MASSLDLADRLFKAIEAGDIDAVRAVYSPKTIIWHNSDNREQTADENLAVLRWVVDRVSERRYVEVRRQPTPTGFVQQHVLRGRLKSGAELNLSACIVAIVANGHIVRIDEYLDSAQVSALR